MHSFTARRLKRAICLLLGGVAACSAKLPEAPLAARPIAPSSPNAGAPSLMPTEPSRRSCAFCDAALARPQIPSGVFDIRSSGRADGKTKATNALRRAIAKASAAGGGTVLVPPGSWLTGPIHLLSNINLHVASGAVLNFSQEFADYLPPVLTRWEGLEVYNYSPLIYARDCENVAVTGGGKLDGQGAAWWPWKKTQKDVAQQALRDGERRPADRVASAGQRG